MAQLRRTRCKCKSLPLFGGDDGWEAADWTEVSDSVRGGKSKSCLDIEKGTACFNGYLDYEALGGAGFASQRTTADDREWDLSDFAGVQLHVAEADKKRYTFIVKDTLPPSDAANEREKATISWECDFELPPQDTPDKTRDKTVFIPWDAFNPTYRGKLQKDVDPLDTRKIRRFSVMIRSFFGAQGGDFSLSINSITAVCEAPPPGDGDEGAIPHCHGKALDLRRLEEGPTPAGRAEKAPQGQALYSLTAELRRRASGGDIGLSRRAVNGLIAAALLFAAYHYLCR